MKRTFLQLAHKYEPYRHFVNNWMVSEKLDGLRAFWDGGITKRILAKEVPFANIDKDFRLKEQQICTGLWTRYGHIIYCPDWWLEFLPKIPLDGELWIGNNKWQELTSIVKSHNKGPGWDKVKFMVFESPSLFTVMEDKEINETNYKKYFRNIPNWIRDKGFGSFLIPPMPFIFSYERLKQANIDNEFVKLHNQIQIPLHHPHEFVEEQLNKIIEKGGEGVVIRNPVTRYECGRSWNVLKYKPYADDEGIVTGYTWGKETELGGKFLGLMGSMILSFKGKKFQLSGFTDEERRMTFIISKNDAREIGEQNPGEIVDDSITNPRFPRGSKVTFKYRELSDGGFPKEAKYWRKYV